MAEAAIVTDAKVTAYVRRYHNGRDAAALFAAIGDKFGAPAGWTVERVAELLALFAAGRAPKEPTPKMLKARDVEVKGLIRDMAEYLTSAAEVRAVVKERFGAERTPALSTVTALLASARYDALHSPRREAPAEPAPPRPVKPKAKRISNNVVRGAAAFDRVGACLTAIRLGSSVGDAIAVTAKRFKCSTRTIRRDLKKIENIPFAQWRNVLRRKQASGGRPKAIITDQAFEYFSNADHSKGSVVVYDKLLTIAAEAGWVVPSLKTLRRRMGESFGRSRSLDVRTDKILAEYLSSQNPE